MANEKERLEKWKKKEEDKRAAKDAARALIPRPKPFWHKNHPKKCNLLERITAITTHVYKNFPYSGKEHHYQAALEAELREAGYMVQQELATQLHYKKQNGEIIIIC